MSTSESERKNILKQMKVRTTYKKDKSWIHQDNSEDERDEISSPISPQRKSFDGKKLLWSTESPDLKTERNSGTFTAREVITSSSSPPIHSSNKQFSYSSNETNKSTSTTSQPSSTSAAKVTPSYIIRGQPVNAVSQVKGPTSFNGYQKSYSSVQPRTSASLPRVPNATGHKMSTEEYKRLAPYNVRSRSADFSDDETSYAQEQPLNTEQTNRIIKSTPQRDRSYVISAAKRTSGNNTPEATSPTLPFVAKKVQIQEDEDSPSKKSQSLPKTLSSYLYDDYKKLENNYRETSSKQTTSQTAPSGTETDRSGGPKLTSYSTSNIVETKKPTIIPEPAKITVVREGSNNNEKTVSKLATEKELPTSTVTTKTGRVETTKKSDALPESLASYLYNDVNSFEKTWKTNQPTNSTSRTVTSSNNSEKTVSKPTAEIELPTSKVTTKTQRVETTKKSDALPESLDSFLSNDVNSFEKTWKSNQATQPTFQTVTIRGTDRPESPKLTSWNTNPESKTSAVLPGPGKITVYRGERETSDLSIPRLTSSNTETKGPILHSEPGKITVLTGESYDTFRESPKATVESRSTTNATETKNTPDAVILTSSSLAANVIDSTKKVQTGPGKITILEDKSDGNNKVNSRYSETTTTTTSGKVSIETIRESTSPKPAPRMETKTKEVAPVKTSYKQEDLISWSDLDNNTNISKTKERSITPTLVPIQSTKDSTKQPTKSSVTTTVDETKDNKARYRVTENLDEPGFDTYSNKSSPGTKRVTITTTETTPERPRTPEPRSSSPRPTPRPRESIKTTVTESRYRVPETLEDTMLEAGPSRSSSRTTVTTTRSTDPVYTEYMEGPTRTVSSSREKITTTTTTVETRHENSSSAEANQYDPQASNKGVLFVKEYVNSRESMKSPTSTGSFSDFSDDMERPTYSTSSSYMYSSAPDRSDEGPCTYCGREIKDCPKIILEHLNIYCHEYCFKCGICNKPMGDLVDSLFIHRDVVHCEGCYEKLF